MTVVKNIVGDGWEFPFETSSKGGIEKLKSDTPNNQIERIRQSIVQILGTSKGERFFLREFGSRIHELVFEPNDLILVGMARKFVIEDIERWEKRVILKEVEPVLDRSRNTLFIKIYFIIRSSSVENNMVYPFFLKSVIT